MAPILPIATSGMIAATQRLQVSADNVANANSDGPLPSADAATKAQFPAAYVAQQVDQVATPGGGTSAVVSDAQPGTVAGYDPAAPYADANGQVAQPNVDYTNEAIRQANASYSFVMNANVVRAYSQMAKTLLDIKT